MLIDPGQQFKDVSVWGAFRNEPAVFSMVWISWLFRGDLAKITEAAAS